MGFFFLLAGYFTPPSLERKGYGKFLATGSCGLACRCLPSSFSSDRSPWRLVQAYEGQGFWPTFAHLWNHAVIINGPLWFAQALLMFSIGYCAWRAIAGTPLPNAERTAASRSAPRVVGPQRPCGRRAALLIRQFVPTGVNIFGLQLGYFASYIFLLPSGLPRGAMTGSSALRGRMRRLMILGLIVSWPLLCRRDLCCQRTSTVPAKPTSAADPHGPRFSMRSGSRSLRGA